jgi:hypothetical protein
MLAERLTAQQLAGQPASGPLEAARRLLAVQGQDPRGARLAIRARTAGGSTAADVDRALSEERSLLITWLNRGTLHLIASEDYAWLHSLTAPALFTANARRLAQEGVMPDAAERAVAVIERALATEGPLTRAQLRGRIAGAGIPTDGQALVHLLMLASLRGVSVRGPMAGREQAYALVRDWLPPQRAPHRERSLAELARRYLAGHGPAGERDLARWSGLRLSDARAGLAAIAAEIDERPDGLLDLRGRATPARVPAPKLLGAFDPLLLGWCSREELLAGNEGIVTVNGLFRPFALVRGRAAATWSLAAGRIVVREFAPLSRRDEDALRRDGMDVARYLGSDVEDVVFERRWDA